MHKIDSLLRGHVGVIVDTLAARGPVIVAAGLPALGRTMRDGVLYVNGIPLPDTTLWHLEDRPAPRSVTELIGRPSALCSSPLEVVDALEAGLVAVVDVADDADLDAVVALAGTVAGAQLVGTAALGAALARTLPLVPQPSSPTVGVGPALTVVGSAAPNAPAQVAALLDRGAVQVALDADRLLAGSIDSDCVATLLGGDEHVVVAIVGPVPVAHQRALSTALGRFIAQVDRSVSHNPDLVLTGERPRERLSMPSGFTPCAPWTPCTTAPSSAPRLTAAESSPAPAVSVNAPASPTSPRIWHRRRSVTPPPPVRRHPP